MEELRRLELRVGFIVLGAVALFLLGITWARGVRIGQKQQQLFLRFPAVAGLEVGAPVFVHGVRKGSVTGIELREGGVRVSIHLESTVQLRRDATARVGLQELTGGRKLDLFPGTSPEPLPAGAEIPGEVTPDVADLMASLGAVGSAVQHLLGRVDTLSLALTQLLTPEAQQSIRSTVDDLAVVVRRLRLATDGQAMEQVLQDLAILTAELRAFVVHNRSALDSTVRSLQRISGAAEQRFEQLERLFEDLQRTTDQLAAVLRKLQDRHTVVGRLMTDEEFARQLDSTVAVLYGFLRQVQQYGVNVNVRLGTRP